MTHVTRRNVLMGATSLLSTAVFLSQPVFAKEVSMREIDRFSPPLPIPPLLTAKDGETISLTMKKARHNFDPREPHKTGLSAGVNADYLGPTIRLQNGQKVSFNVRNRLGEVTTMHWHGLFVPSMADGGPHNLIEDGKDWKVDIEVNQPASLNWYHPHVHQETARQAHMGLAGLMIVDDGKDDERGLPHEYGVDDIPLVLQDRRFIEGDIFYQTDMIDLQHGYRGDKLIVNGIINPHVEVPKGIVRLRFLNGANARVFTLSFNDNRPFSVIASDGGYITKPVEVTNLTISPGERYEILVDFSNGNKVFLQTAEFDEGNGKALPLMQFNVNDSKPITVTAIPTKLDGPDEADKSFSIRERSFAFNERTEENIKAAMKHADGDHNVDGHMSGHDMSGHNTAGHDMGGHMNHDEHMQHGGRTIAEMGAPMTALNSGMAMAMTDKTFDMNRIDVKAKLGSYEIWKITSDEMAHPFHIHGASFRVLTKDGKTPPAHELGWKDTVLVNKDAELLIHFNREGAKANPFMFHCHVLEHEDLGMMAQFITEQ